MIKVTIEHDEGTEVLESEAAFVVCESLNNDYHSVNVKTIMTGELPGDKPEAFVQAFGNGVRSIISAIGAAGVEEAERNFFVGFVGKATEKDIGKSILGRIREIIAPKEEEKKEAENNG